MGRGDVALENDEMEGRQGLGKRVLQRRKEFGRWSLGRSIKGTLFMLAGPAEAGRNQGEGEGTKKRQLRSTDGDGSTSQLCRAVLEGDGQLKEGTAASVERTGRPGQLACPEDMLEQLCRPPKAIWLTRTYLAHQVTLMSARLPQPTLSLSARPPNSSTLQPLWPFR